MGLEVEFKTMGLDEGVTITRKEVQGLTPMAPAH